jgi:hypothetical protein
MIIVYIILTLLIIVVCLIIIRVVTNDIALRLTSIIYNYDYDELKELMRKKVRGNE